MPTRNRLQKRFSLPLRLAAAGYRIFHRIRTSLQGKGIVKSETAVAPSVRVGGLSIGCGGTLWLTSWLLGWAVHRGKFPIVATKAHHIWQSDLPRVVETSDTPKSIGMDKYLLSSYRPETKIIIGSTVSRAAAAARDRFSADMVFLHDDFSGRTPKAQANLAILDVRDLAEDWNIVFPAGWFRETVESLHRADAIMLYISELEFKARQTLIRKRLEQFKKPVFSFSIRAWRLRRGAFGEPAADLNEEPYLLVASEQDDDMAFNAATELLGLRPRMRYVVPQHHIFNKQQFEFLHREATRLRCKHIVCTPGQAIGLVDHIETPHVWSLEPHVTFGPRLHSKITFPQWWDIAWGYSDILGSPSNDTDC
ncbi:tetraacyldisaccharide 4'-kinase [Desulfovibrio inopinatus]|uniref:tetraacyldisaccharide 4'-kinase n=1 Tax=Desulfovibrio inopinatus TaxID=102109 RepID=UPI000405C5FE|nr:tetraacyldisaccharide 4'-kinase [Desulfovibrio inopinatus]